jgi:hypothetical protein
MPTPKDIRDASSDRYWSAFEKSWTNLLTYRYLGRTNPVLDRGVEMICMPLRHDMRNAGGGIMAAPLCIAAAESGGMHDDLYVPSPVSAGLQILDDARGVQRVQALPETVRLGRNMGFSRSLIVDANRPERVIALSADTTVSLGRAPPGYVKVDNRPLEVVDAPDMPRLHEIFGVRQIEAGMWEIPRLEAHNASPDAVLHLGPQHIAMEAAATDLACRCAGTELLQIRSWQVLFVARGKQGPFQTRSQAWRGGTRHVAVRVELIDTGAQGRLVATASAVFES